MKYYSSMFLQDYLDLYWQEMDPELVKLCEKEIDERDRKLEMAMDEADIWSEDYHALRRETEFFKFRVQSLVAQLEKNPDQIETILQEFKKTILEMELGI